MSLTERELELVELALSARADHWKSRLSSPKGPAREMRSAAEHAEQSYRMLHQKFRGVLMPVQQEEPANDK